MSRRVEQRMQRRWDSKLSHDVKREQQMVAEHRAIDAALDAQHSAIMAGDEAIEWMTSSCVYVIYLLKRARSA